MTNTENNEKQIHNNGRDEIQSDLPTRASAAETGWRWGDPDPLPPLPHTDADTDD